MTRGGNAFPLTRYPSMYSPCVLRTTSNAPADPAATKVSSVADNTVHARAGRVVVDGRFAVTVGLLSGPNFAWQRNGREFPGAGLSDGPAPPALLAFNIAVVV